MREVQEVQRVNLMVLKISKSHVCIKPKRLGKLAGAICAVLRRPGVSGYALEVILGHLTWYFLGRRCSLAIFKEVYVHVHLHGPRVAPLSPSARRELSLAVAILPLIRVDLRMPWSPLVHAYDASTFGTGICTQEVDQKVVAEIGGVSEHWRFKDAVATQARLHVLGSEGPTDHSVESESGFDEVPRDVLEFDKWQVVHSGRIRRKEHITRTEGRALVWSVRHALRRSSGVGQRHLFLGDNMVLNLASCKGRSGSPLLVPVLREMCATMLATGSFFSCRWIPSELNVADDPSRIRSRRRVAKVSTEGFEAKNIDVDRFSPCFVSDRGLAFSREAALQEEDFGSFGSHHPPPGGRAESPIRSHAARHSEPIFLRGPRSQGEYAQDVHEVRIELDRLVPRKPPVVERRGVVGSCVVPLLRRDVLLRPLGRGGIEDSREPQARDSRDSTWERGTTAKNDACTRLVAKTCPSQSACPSPTRCLVSNDRPHDGQRRVSGASPQVVVELPRLPSPRRMRPPSCETGDPAVPQSRESIP